MLIFLNTFQVCGHQPFEENKSLDIFLTKEKASEIQGAQVICTLISKKSGVKNQSLF